MSERSCELRFPQDMRCQPSMQCSSSRFSGCIAAPNVLASCVARNDVPPTICQLAQRVPVGVHALACPRWSSRFSVPLLEFTLERARARRTSSRCSANCRRASFPPGVGSSTQGTSVPFRPSPAPNGAAGPGLPWLLAAFAVPPRPERSGHRLATSLQWGLAVSSTQFVLYDDSVQGKLSNQEAPSRGPVAQR